MLDIKDTYSLMFTDYPDIVNFVQMKQMLGGISDTLAYRMLREKKIKSKKVGRLPRLRLLSSLRCSVHLCYYYPIVVKQLDARLNHKKTFMYPLSIKISFRKGWSYYTLILIKKIFSQNFNNYFLSSLFLFLLLYTFAWFLH